MWIRKIQLGSSLSAPTRKFYIYGFYHFRTPVFWQDLFGILLQVSITKKKKRKYFHCLQHEIVHCGRINKNGNLYCRFLNALLGRLRVHIIILSVKITERK